MGTEEAPEPVRGFILQYIDSAELLQVLLLLQEEPDREWTTESLAAQLRSSVSSIEKRLNDLYDRRVLRPPGPGRATHRFHPTNEQVSQALRGVADYNRTYPYRILELIYSRPIESLRAFADAFKLKRDKE